MPPAIHYCVHAHDVHGHLFGVTVRIAQPAAIQRVSLPVWIVGSYMVREFSKQLIGLRASQGKKNIEVTQINKNTWQIVCDTAQTLNLQYQVHAHDNSVRTAWLDAHRGFFNATSICLQVDGQHDATHVLEIQPPQHAQD